MLTPPCLPIESCGLFLTMFSVLGLLVAPPLVCEPALDLGRVSPLLVKLVSTASAPLRVPFPLLYPQGECLGIDSVRAGTCLVLADPRLVLAEESLVVEEGLVIGKGLVWCPGHGGG